MSHKMYGWAAAAVGAAILTAIIGWFLNIYQLAVAAMSWGADTNIAMVVFRAVGILLFPIGAVLGYL